MMNLFLIAVPEGECVSARLLDKHGNDISYFGADASMDLSVWDFKNTPPDRLYEQYIKPCLVTIQRFDPSK